MILVVGGIVSGKRTYIKSLGYGESDWSGDVDDGLPVLIDAQELVRAEDSDVTALADSLAAGKRIVACRDVGSGIVPMSREDRMWRDRVGSLTQALARRARSVVRMSCGIPEPLKGGLPQSSVELVVMRHGATEANEKRQYAGKTDVPLTAGGEAQAVQAGVCERVRTVYVSPLSRARRTAEICFPNAGQTVVDDLREMDFGEFEGRSAADMEHDAAYREWVDGYCEGRCPGGECRAELTERVARAVEDIVRNALRNGERRVVIVGHGGTVMAAMHSFSKSDRGYFEWHAGNCGGYRARARFGENGLELEDEQQFDDLGFLIDDPLGPDGHPVECASFFTNRACKHFPCHEGVDDRDFNCLFCYCPLYALGPECGGDFTYTKSGRKNCTHCSLPHQGVNGTKLVAARYEKLARLAGMDR